MHKIKDVALTKELIHYWIRKDKFILLMDGLDRLSEEDSQSFLKAINTFRQNRNFSTMILSCELYHFESLERNGNKLNIGETRVVINAFNDDQKQNYMSNNGAAILGKEIYKENKYPNLKKIANSLPILEALVKIYPDKLDQKIIDIESEDTLWKEYSNRCIDKEKCYNGQNALYWLKRLAKHLKDKQYFYYDSNNLPTENGANIIYCIITWVIIFLLSIIPLLLVGPSNFPPLQLFGITVIIVAAIIAGFNGIFFKSILTMIYTIALCFLALVLIDFSMESIKGENSFQKKMDILKYLTAFFFCVILLIIVVYFLSRWPIWLTIPAALLIGGLLLYTHDQLYPGNIAANKFEFKDELLDLKYLLIARQVLDVFPLKKPSPTLSSAQKRSLYIGFMSVLIISSSFFILKLYFLPVVVIAISIWLDSGFGVIIRSYILRFCFYWGKVLPWNTEFLDDVVKNKLLIRHENIYNFYFGTLLRNYFQKKGTDGFV